MSTTPDTNPTPKQVQEQIAAVCDELRTMLLQKNRAYGNSALEPVRVFSKADTLEQINVRLDDKLSRLARGQNAGEDPEWDIMGYLVLKRVHQRLYRVNVVTEDEQPEQDKIGDKFRVMDMGSDYYQMAGTLVQIDPVDHSRFTHSLKFDRPGYPHPICFERKNLEKLTESK